MQQCFTDALTRFLLLLYTGKHCWGILLSINLHDCCSNHSKLLCSEWSENREQLCWLLAGRWTFVLNFNIFISTCWSRVAFSYYSSSHRLWLNSWIRILLFQNGKFPFTHWWQRPRSMVPPAHQALWGSASCPRTLRRADCRGRGSISGRPLCLPSHKMLIFCFVCLHTIDQM